MAIVQENKVKETFVSKNPVINRSICLLRMTTTLISHRCIIYAVQPTIAMLEQHSLLFGFKNTQLLIKMFMCMASIATLFFVHGPMD